MSRIRLAVRQLVATKPQEGLDQAVDATNEEAPPASMGTWLCKTVSLAPSVSMQTLYLSSWFIEGLSNRSSFSFFKAFLPALCASSDSKGFDETVSFKCPSASPNKASEPPPTKI